MNRQSIKIPIIALFAIFDVSAKNKHKEYPRAEIKVGYTYHETFVRGSDGIKKRDIPFILLANNEQSKFYNTKTEYMDSLESTPQGRSVSDKLFNDAIKRYTETKDEFAMKAGVYQTFLYIFHSAPDNRMTVYDKAGSLEMQEGPWKLTGLPGLILEARESTEPRYSIRYRPSPHGG